MCARAASPRTKCRSWPRSMTRFRSRSRPDLPARSTSSTTSVACCRRRPPSTFSSVTATTAVISSVRFSIPPTRSMAVRGTIGSRPRPRGHATRSRAARATTCSFRRTARSTRCQAISSAAGPVSTRWPTTRTLRAAHPASPSASTALPTTAPPGSRTTCSPRSRTCPGPPSPTCSWAGPARMSCSASAAMTCFPAVAATPAAGLWRERHALGR